MKKILQQFGYYRPQDLKGKVIGSEPGSVRDGDSVHVFRRNGEIPGEPLEEGDLMVETVRHRSELLRVLACKNRIGLIRVTRTGLRLSFNEVLLVSLRRKATGEVYPGAPDPSDAKIFVERMD